MNRNEKIINSFAKYCKENPEQRFWQALKNWSGKNFILVADDLEDTLTFMDTFYFEEKNQ